MRYAAMLHKEGKHTLVEFPDAPGCQTFAESGEEVAAVAQEALEGWLEAEMAAGRAPHRPRRRLPPASARILHVTVPIKLAVKLEIRWARLERKMSQGDLAALIGAKQPFIAEVESPDSNTTLETLEKVAHAMGLRWEPELRP